MTYISDLEDARDNIATLLKNMTANPKPSYSIDGQTIQWSAYFRMLTDKLETINQAISAGNPFEETMQGYT